MFFNSNQPSKKQTAVLNNAACKKTIAANIFSVVRKYLLLLFATSIVLLQSCEKPDFKPVSNSLNSATNFSASLTRPNIIIILGDDVGYDALDSHGNQTFNTPRIDQMAREGMDFTQCQSAPLCSPSRFMLVSGQYNFRNYTVWGTIDPNQKTFATLLRDAGYATYVAGKWQFDGGDAAIHSLGFSDYSVWDPSKDLNAGSHYKDPKIYEHGAFLPSDQLKGKYGDDIFTDRVLSFIQQNKQKNFFVYFPITLCHYPYCPTPDDPAFAKWDNHTSNPNPRFFPSMIQYMDKKIGQVIDSLKKWGLYNNTILMFMGDNGTPHYIYYYVNGVYMEGGKAETNASGTHVPLVVTWPAKISGGQINRNMVDFTDFLPTLADAAGVSIPASYGPIDGVSFYSQLAGLSFTPRPWIFDHYAPATKGHPDKLTRWIQDTTYKLYDISGRFFNIYTDPLETKPIAPSDRTPDQKKIVQNFQSIMDTLK